MLPAPAFPQGAPRCAECITLIIQPGQVVTLPAPLEGLTVLVRASSDLAATGRALDAVGALGGKPGLLADGPSPVPGGIVQRSGTVFIDVRREASDAAADLDALAFVLKTRLTELRAQAADAILGLLVTPQQRAALAVRDIVPYLDRMAVVDLPLRPPPWPLAGSALAAVLPAETSPDRLPADGSVSWLWSAPPDAIDASALARDLARAMPLLPAGLLRGGAAEVACGGKAAQTYLNPRTLDTIAVAVACWGAPLVAPPGTVIAETVQLSNGDRLARIPAAEGQFADDVRVVGSRSLSVEEIVARHQAAAARARAVVRTLISSGTMTLTFEAPGFPAPVAIGSETVIYEGDGRTEIEQRRVSVNGLEFTGGGVPRLPILEPERVAAPPLAITLSDLYRYTLAGEDRIEGTRCYVVRFEPVERGAALFRGRAWIAADSFAMLRVAAEQTGLRGPIVASEQVDEFSRHQSGVWLLARSAIRQLYEGAGHRTPIHRVTRIVSHEVNPPDFEARRRAAHQSAAVMLRDTPQGFRYLRREGGADGAAAERAIASAAQRVRTLAFGVIVDPNITRPLPFAGLSYLDFNFLGSGAHVNAFFGGTYGQLAFSVPSIRGTRWQLAGRAFGIASSYNDRAFEDGREQYERNISQRPAHASVWLLRPLTPAISVRAGYDLDYTRFRGATGTSPRFIVPADQLAHSLRIAMEAQRRGWNATLWWAGSRRSGWRAWGTGRPEYDASHRDYQRYGAALARPIVCSPSFVARIEAAWMDGRDLDRFSRYNFGAFDNRLRGYPSALIRYDQGGVLRSAAAWSAGRRFRVDGFADTAYVHDAGFGSGLRRYSGVGAAIEAPAPFGVLAAVEWGYGFQGVNANGRRGTQVLRVSGFKVF